MVVNEKIKKTQSLSSQDVFKHIIVMSLKIISSWSVKIKL